MGLGTDHHPAWLRGPLEPGGGVQRVAHRPVLDATATAHRAQNREARLDADAYLEALDPPVSL